MPDLAEGQSSNDTSVQTIDGEAQSTTVAGAAGTPGADAAATGTEGEVTFDLSSVDGILAAAKTNDNLRQVIERERKNGENTARQRLENDLRRDQGARERAVAYQQLLSAKYGVALDEADTRQLPGFVKANEDFIRAEQSRALMEAAAKMASGDAAAMIRAEAADLDASPDAMTKAAERTLGALADRLKSSALEDVSFDDLLKIDKHNAEYHKRLEAEVATELKAQKTEGQQQTAPPKVSGTGAPGSAGLTAEQARAMSAADAAKLPEDQYRAWQKAITSTYGATAR